MKKIETLIQQYGLSHQNNVNKLIHWICVPIILFTIIGIVAAIPFLSKLNTWIFNWGGILLAVTSWYYWRISKTLFVGFLTFSILFLYLNHLLGLYLSQQGIDQIQALITMFILAWIGQFIGHSIEGKRPSFFQDLQFLLIGPAWLLHFMYKKIGIEL